MKKTKFESYNINGLPNGCKYCIRGEKTVLFIGGKCSRACWYCSLSDFRKKSNDCFANERIVKKNSDLIEEVNESNSKGVGITGGDPLVYFKKTLEYAKMLKKEFGKDFHIHIYLPPKLVTKEKLKQLEPFIDEFRFHPSFLISQSEKEIDKIKLASKICGKSRIGIELPMIPEKTKDIYEYILEIKELISFVNLNEFEISETNFNIITKKYTLNEDTYTIRNSITQGKKLIKKLNKTKLKIHLCTARTKDCFQYINRLKNHNILQYGKRTSDGNIIYYVIYSENIKKDLGKISKNTNKFILDEKNKRFIISKKTIRNLSKNTNLKIEKILEPPVFNADYMERETIN